MSANQGGTVIAAAHKVETSNHACTNLLTNSDHKPESKSDYLVYLVCICHLAYVR